jgi:hypothetical protein
MDLAKPEMRALIDLRNKPQFMQALSSRAPEQAASDRAAEMGPVMMPRVDDAADGRISTH